MPELSSSPTEIFSDTGRRRRRPVRHRRRSSPPTWRWRQTPGERRRRRKGKGVLFWMALGWIVAITFCADLRRLPAVRALLQQDLPGLQAAAVHGSTGSAPTRSATTSSPGASTAPGCRSPSPASAAVLGLLFGAIFGLIAGYYRRKADTVISTGVDIMLAFPALILLLSITGLPRRQRPQRDPGARHPVGPAAHPHRAGQHARVRPTGVRAGGQEPRRQEPPHPRPRDPAQHRARPC